MESSSSSSSSTSYTSSDSESPPSPPVKRRRQRQSISAHQCPKCPKSFRRAQDLAVHVRRHEGNKPHRCHTCGKTFCTIFELRQHTPTHTGERPYPCRYCPQEFATLSALHNHLPTHLPMHRRARLFVCDLCPASFTSTASLTAHTRTHTDQCPHQCDTCGRAFPQKSNLLRHLQCHEKEKAKGKALPCPNCSKVFHGKEHLEAHRSMCANFHRCCNCGKGFTLEADLKDHIARKHNLPSEKEEEDDGTSLDSEGEEGTSSHTQGGEGGETSSDETEHNASHRNIFSTLPTTVKRSKWTIALKARGKKNSHRVLKCPSAASHCHEEYGEVLRDESGGNNNQSDSSDPPDPQPLKEDSKRHTEDTAVPCTKRDMAAANFMKRSCPRYDCPKCEVFFDKWDTLKTHMALKHKEQLLSSKYLFRCHLCVKTFSQNSNLKTHLKSHDRVALFICDVCREGFSLKHHLQRHKDRKHSVESQA